MSNAVVVYKNRTNTLEIDLGFDVSADTITSQIRSEPTLDAPLIVEWEVEFKTDGVDGKLILTIDDLEASQISANSGYMDLKRVSGGEPLPVFDEPLDVIFRGGGDRMSGEINVEARTQVIIVDPSSKSVSVISAGPQGPPGEDGVGGGDLTAHLTDTTDAHDASAISVVPFSTIAATNVQAALEEIVSEGGGGGGGSPTGAAGGVLGGTYPNPSFAADMATQAELDAIVSDTAYNAGTWNGVAGIAPSKNAVRDIIEALAASAVLDGDSAGGVLAGTFPNPSFASDMATQAELDAHISDSTDVHEASAIKNTPSGGIAGNTVQAAINELDSEKAALASAVMDGDTAGGVLGGTYPNPSFAADMATQAELDAIVSDTAYNAGTWDGVTGIAPSKNAVRDKIEAVVAAAVNDGDAAGGVLAGTYPNPSFASDMATQAELDAIVSDTAYNATSWNGVTGIAPSKNAVRDELEVVRALVSPTPHPTQQRFTSGSGTYTTPANCTLIRVTVIGGGGGGGGAAGSGSGCAGAGGGQAGSWCIKLISSPASSYAYSIGAAGAGGTAGNNSGTTGGDTTFGSGGSLITAKGGGGGLGSAATTANPDSNTGGNLTTASTGGDLNVIGEGGGVGLMLNSTHSIGGAGGSGPRGTGGAPSRLSNATGRAGSGYGAGGGGSSTAFDATNRAGGAGTIGEIIVEEFYGT